MSKIILIIILGVYSYSVGQTCMVDVCRNSNSFGCYNANYSWTISSVGSGNGITSGSATYYYVPYNNSYTISNSGSCQENTNPRSSYCNEVSSLTISFLDLLNEKVDIASACPGSVWICELIPNVRIQNLNYANPTGVCAGEALSLAALNSDTTTGEFPKEVYHWQYSLDNQSSWINVPDVFNWKKTTMFSLQEILGISHENYFGKVILFRLGGGSFNRSYTTPISITYSPCAPLIKEIVYLQPKCAGDNIQNLGIAFDRPLESDEYLYAVKIKDALDGRIASSINLARINYTGNTLQYPISDINIEALINNKSYKIEYQAFKGTIGKGTMTSTQSFTHIVPPEMKFTITEPAKSPSCFNITDGSIEISIVSGRSPYKFYNGTTTITPVIVNGKYYIQNLGAEEYKIKVTDANGCIDKRY